MKKYTKSPVALVLSISVFLLILSGCTTPDEGKIPITTKSKKAREYYIQGRDLSERLRGQESIQYYEKAIAEDPDFAIAHLNLSFVQPSAKAFFASFNKAKALADKVSEGERLWIMGVEAAVNGFPMKQKEFLEKLVETYPQDERAHNLIASYYFGQQEYVKAIEEYKKAVEIAPNFSQPYNQLGYAYKFQENFSEAENAFKKYIELIPNDPNPYDSYAELLMKMGRFDESIETYRKALLQNPNFLLSFIGIATNLNLKGNHEEARAELQKLYDLARNDGERRTALFATAVSYVDEGSLDKALEEQQKQYVLAEKINDASAMSGDLTVSGNILLEIGEYDKALEMFEKSVELIEKSDLVEEVKENTRRGHLYNAARVALMKQDYTAAKANSYEYGKQVAAVNNPFQIRLSHQLAGMIAFEEKEYEKAVEEFQQANQQNPYNLYRLALTYKEMGDMEKAKKFCTKAINYNVFNNMNYAFLRTKSKQSECWTRCKE